MVERGAERAEDQESPSQDPVRGCRWLTLCRGHGVPHPKGPSRESKRSSI